MTNGKTGCPWHRQHRKRWQKGHLRRVLLLQQCKTKTDESEKRPQSFNKRQGKKSTPPIQQQPRHWVSQMGHLRSRHSTNRMPPSKQIGLLHPLAATKKQ